MSEDFLLRARGVSVELGGRRIVDGVDLTAPRGQWIGIIGANGAGKSTLLRALAGVLPFTGEVRLAGRDLRALGARDRASRLAYVPQSPQMNPDMTVGAYVLLGRTPHIGYLRRESSTDRAIARQALERLELDHFASRSLGTLSGGELQCVVLARALAQESDLLLLDEPTSALDLGNQQRVLDWVESIRSERGAAICMTMHDVNLAALYADRLILMADGRVVATGAAAEVLTEANVERFYGARVTVSVDADGQPTVRPRRAGTPGSVTQPRMRAVS